MKLYLSVFKLRIIYGLQYRTAAIAGIATQFFFGFIFIMIYQAFYNNSPDTQPISFVQMVSYMWMQQAFLGLIFLYSNDSELSELITTGNIAYEWCRPVNIYFFWYCKLLAQRISSTALRCTPVLIVSYFLPKPYNLQLPPNHESFIFFLITLSLGLFITCSLSMLIYSSVFITLSSAGSFSVISGISEFFAGLVIAIPLMPKWLQTVTSFLPFRYTCDLPFRIYAGNIPVNEALTGIAVQIIWIILLIPLGAFCFHKIIRKIVVQGG